MPYVPPKAIVASTSSCLSFLPSPQPVLSPIYTPPPSPGHALTSPLHLRRTQPISIPCPRRHRSLSPSSSSHTSSSASPTRFPLTFAHTDSTEILRHGKHAQSSGQSQQSSKPVKAEKQPSPTQAQLNAERKEQERQAHYHQQQQQQAQAQYDGEMGGQGLAAGMSPLGIDDVAYVSGQAKGGAPAYSPNYREEAERIVAEERANTEKMPVYEVGHRCSRRTRSDIKGLEEFRLVEKMGDGAFSNVYKAIERKTGMKCAVKVVRKYELNHSQVRTNFSSPHTHPFLRLPKPVSCTLATYGVKMGGETTTISLTCTCLLRCQSRQPLPLQIVYSD